MILLVFKPSDSFSTGEVKTEKKKEKQINKQSKSKSISEMRHKLN